MLNGQCLDNCPAQYFVDFNYKCQNCSQECLECFDQANNSCSSCKDKKFLLEGTCVDQCPEQLYFQTNQQCLKCFESCLSCNGPNSNNCISCKEFLFFSQNQCLDKCLNGFYNDDKICKLCNSNCLTCIGPFETNCTSCAQSFFNPQNLSCSKQNCKEGTYPDIKDWTCKNCSKQCQTCNGPLDNNCLICSSERVLYNGQCLTTCPYQTFISSQNICSNCHISCLNCSGPLSSDCLTCNQGFYRNLNLCQGCPFKNCIDCGTTAERCIKCQSGFYKEQEMQTCLPCSAHCLNCENEKICTQCIQGYYFNKTFVSEVSCTLCDFDKFTTQQDESQNLSCYNCPFKCMKCKDNNICLQCEVNYKLKEDYKEHEIIKSGQCLLIQQSLMRENGWITALITLAVVSGLLFLSRIGGYSWFDSHIALYLAKKEDKIATNTFKNDQNFNQQLNIFQQQRDLEESKNDDFLKAEDMSNQKKYGVSNFRPTGLVQQENLIKSSYRPVIESYYNSKFNNNHRIQIQIQESEDKQSKITNGAENIDQQQKEVEKFQSVEEESKVQNLQLSQILSKNFNNSEFKIQTPSPNKKQETINSKFLTASQLFQ